ncbi:hypothetical protein VTN77DRAFT_5755 [Rasamsonia byssochlamydoides]|uniref:uncharacterized protein n=1 Tax=Rasamsonia byssochlamydoides TaxID=89139 RepID=UPI00374485F8
MESSTPTTTHVQPKTDNYVVAEHDEMVEKGTVTVDPDDGLTEQEKEESHRRLLRKIDLRVVPILSFLYLLCFLDRTNIGNAKLDNLQQDLHMSNSQYNAALSVFFVSYALFESVSNVLLKKLRPSVFIPGIMVIWGACMTCMGLVHNGAGLIAVRFFLGLAEAGLFPGVSYIMSCWYKRSELGVRVAIFFSAAALAGSFGGLLAAAIADMDGVGGKAGWAWIFILEGLATVVIGVIAFWIVPDFPEDAKFLTESERRQVIHRLAIDHQMSAEPEKFKFSYFGQVLRDWKTYTACVIFGGVNGALYSFALFVPTIINEMGNR